MKMKLPLSEGGVITIKANQKTTQKCYESSLKNHRGAYDVTIQARDSRRIIEVNVRDER